MCRYPHEQQLMRIIPLDFKVWLGTKLNWLVALIESDHDAQLQLTVINTKKYICM